MKIALVGIGKIALDQHVPAIAASPEWELAATVSRSMSGSHRVGATPPTTPMDDEKAAKAAKKKEMMEKLQALQAQGVLAGVCQTWQKQLNKPPSILQSTSPSWRVVVLIRRLRRLSLPNLPKKWVLIANFK